MYEQHCPVCSTHGQLAQRTPIHRNNKINNHISRYVSSSHTPSPLRPTRDLVHVSLEVILPREAFLADTALVLAVHPLSAGVVGLNVASHVTLLGSPHKTWGLLIVMLRAENRPLVPSQVLAFCILERELWYIMHLDAVTYFMSRGMSSWFKQDTPFSTQGH